MKDRENGLLRVSSIVFIFETIFVQLSYTRRIYIYKYIYICELKSIAESASESPFSHNIMILHSVSIFIQNWAEGRIDFV